MAGGNNVKKGFGTYLFIFLSIIVLTFLVMIGVMVLSPTTSLLGLKYFYYNEENKITATALEQEINYNNLQEVNFNTNYSNIVIVRELKIDKPYIQINTMTLGFARAKYNDTDFYYRASFVDGDSTKLNIEVKEPNGFLFLEKNITLTYFVPASYTSSFENIKLNVVTESGSLTLGNSGKVGGEEIKTNFDYINYKTTNGVLVLNEYVGQNINQLFFKSVGGGIVNYANINVTNKLDIFSTSGNLKLGNLAYTGTGRINLQISNSKLSATNLSGDVDLDIKDGYIDVEKFTGALDSTNSLNEMGRATINIKEIDGDVSLPNANASIFNVGKISNNHQLYFSGKNGSVNVGETNGECWIETTSGSVTVSTSAKDVWVKTTTGKINVEFHSNEILDQLDFISEKGTVNLAIKSDLAFILKAYNSRGDFRSSSNINIDCFGKNFDNPLVINGGTKVVSITTDAKINISLL